MTTTETYPGIDLHRVEISGWDENQIFFVEKSDMAWDEFAGKHVSLEHMLPDGAIVFVRSIQPIALQMAPPIPYAVEFIGCDPEGARQFRLNSVFPHGERESMAAN